MKELHQLTIKEVHEGYKNNTFTCEQLVRHFLSRIEKYNSKLNIYLCLNQNALSEALKIDAEIKKSGVTKPLQGIPFAVKDNFLTVGMVTTASSNILKDYFPQYESTVTKKLLDSGAIILGKTNMDAFAHGSSTETSDFGPTLNPWNPEHLPGGSSGGSAAAISAGLATVALGSETAGSIRQPAAWCGVTGFKPTYGRSSRYGVIAMASSTDTPGPIAKSVEDCALITEVIAGADTYDATSTPKPVPEYSELLTRNDLKGIRVGLIKEYLLTSMDQEVTDKILNAAEKFKSLGATVEEVSLMDPQYSIGVYTVLQRSEVSSNLARLDGIRFGHPRSVFNEENKRRIMLGTYTLSAGYYDAFYKKSLAVRTQIIEDFAKAFQNFDVLIGAVSPCPAQKVGATKDQPMFGEMEDILVEASSIAGLTSISVPCGYVNNLPIGLQITGNHFDEEKVLTVAKVYQDNTDFVMFPDLEKTL